jgi:hypothetical protein
MAKSQEKRRKYAGYLLEPEVFFPLPFSRTNALSREIFDFCEAVDKHFPDHFRVERKLRATFARAVYVGVAQHVNLAVRRMQVSVAARVKAPVISPAAILSPFISLSRFRLVPRAPANLSPCFTSALSRLCRMSCTGIQDGNGE